MATKAPLTLFTLDAYRLIIAEDLDFADDCIRQLIEDSQTSPFFGFDIELKTSGAVRLIQLASRNCVYVFEIDKLGAMLCAPHILITFARIPGSLSSFLSNQAYVKMGVGVIGKGIVEPLIRRYAEDVHRRCQVVDVFGQSQAGRGRRAIAAPSYVRRDGSKKGLSFSDCVALETLCELWLDAATDAAVAVAIYQRMIEVPLLKNARRTLWVFVEYDTLNKLAVGLVDYPPHAAMSMRLIDTMEGTLKKMKQTLEHANEALSDDGTSWTEKMMPETVELCDTMTQAFTFTTTRWPAVGSSVLSRSLCP
ncbi:hypothetical protein IMY05_C2125000300 [Salix suchowensis]|nr:hypothetical protein IMY05_C2125000300 [Salix suchowensis]